jgi:hypothetical protein
MKSVVRAALLVLVATATAVCQAQRMPMAGPSTGGLGQLPGISFGRPRVAVGFGRRSVVPRFVSPGGIPVYFGSDEPTDVIVENIVPPAQQQPVVLQQKEVEEPEPPAPLILEKVGDRWVRRAPGAEKGKPLAPTVLIFRDGARTTVSRYVIVSGTLYENAEHWTRKIEIADLDIPATIRTNQKRGVEFRLPVDQNEVITRP